jgi:hypothetical protein
MSVFEKALVGAVLATGVGVAVNAAPASAHDIAFKSYCEGPGPEVVGTPSNFDDQIGGLLTTTATNGFKESRIITKENENLPINIEAGLGAITVKSVWPGKPEGESASFVIVACVPVTTEQTTTTTTTPAETTTTLPKATTTTTTTTTLPPSTTVETTILKTTTTAASTTVPAYTTTPTTEAKPVPSTISVETSAPAVTTTTASTIPKIVTTSPNTITPITQPKTPKNPLPATGTRNMEGQGWLAAGFIGLGALAVRLTRRKNPSKA